MALSVVTNLASLNAQRRLERSSSVQNRALQRLSSGRRVNSASDDAAGLAISEHLRAQLRSVRKAERNTQDGISLLQVAEGAMAETTSMLIRGRELAVQAANDTVGSVERQFLHEEVMQLNLEMTRLSRVTEFNGTQLLDGSATSLTFQVGFRNTTNDRVTVSFPATDYETLYGGVLVPDLRTRIDAADSLSIFDDAINSLASARADIGAWQNRLQTTMENLNSTHEHLSAARSRIMDADVAVESSEMARSNILMQAGVSVLAQANQIPSMALSLLDGGGAGG
jgi:flagellin